MPEELSREEIEDLWDFYIRHRDNKPVTGGLRVRGGFATLLRSLFEQESLPQPSAGLVAWIANDIFGSVNDEVDHGSFVGRFNVFWRARKDIQSRYTEHRSSWSSGVPGNAQAHHSLGDDDEDLVIALEAGPVDKEPAVRMLMASELIDSGNERYEKSAELVGEGTVEKDEMLPEEQEENNIGENYDACGDKKCVEDNFKTLDSSVRKGVEESPGEQESMRGQSQTKWKDLEMERLLKKVELAEERRAAAEELALSREVELEKVSRNVQRLEEVLKAERSMRRDDAETRRKNVSDSNVIVEEQLAALHRSRACLATAVAAASNAVATSENVWDRPAQLTSILFEILDNAKSLAQSEANDYVSVWRDLFVDLCNILVQLVRADKRAQRLMMTRS